MDNQTKVQLAEIAVRALSILSGLCIGIFGHDWTGAAIAIGGGNGVASIAAKTAKMILSK